MTKKQKQISDKISISNIRDIQSEYIVELETNPKYSLSVDPTNNYNFTNIEKKFISNYVNLKSLPQVAELLHIKLQEANEMFSNVIIQSEIRRINMALYQRQFVNRLLSIDEIGGYLTSLLTDDYMPSSEILNTSEKLKVVDMLIKINELKRDSFSDSNLIMAKDIDAQIKNLSVKTIKQMLLTDNCLDKKNEIINNAKGSEKLSPEEKAFLSTLPTNELLKLLNNMNDTKKGGKTKNE